LVGRGLGTPASVLLNGLQFTPYCEQVFNGSVAIVAHELQLGVASLVQAPASPPLLELLELLDASLPPLLLLAPDELLLAPDELLLAPLELPSSPPPSIGLVGGPPLLPLSHAIAAIEPAAATRATAVTLRSVALEGFISWPRSSQSGRRGWSQSR
jgi:hypothetical protein